MSSAKWQNIAGSKEFFTGFDFKFESDCETDTISRFSQNLEWYVLCKGKLETKLTKVVEVKGKK